MIKHQQKNKMTIKHNLIFVKLIIEKEKWSKQKRNIIICTHQIICTFNNEEYGYFQ